MLRLASLNAVLVDAQVTSTEDLAYGGFAGFGLTLQAQLCKPMNVFDLLTCPDQPLKNTSGLFPDEPWGNASIPVRDAP